MPAEKIDHRSVKERGNAAFNKADYEEAERSYSRALQMLKTLAYQNSHGGIELSTEEKQDMAVLYKNRAACNLKLGNFEKVVSDCNKALKIVPMEKKALLRRCQAYEALEKWTEAFADAQMLVQIDKTNKLFQETIKRLRIKIEEKIKEQNSLGHRISKMLEIAFDESAELQRRVQAVNNFIVLAKEPAGAEALFHLDGLISRLVELSISLQDVSVILAVVRVLSMLARGNPTRSRKIYETVGLRKIELLFYHTDLEITSAAADLLRQILESAGGIESFHQIRQTYEDKKAKYGPQGLGARPHYKPTEEEAALVDEIMKRLVKLLDHRKVTAHGRDAIVELLTKMVTIKDGAYWAPKFVEETDGISRLLEIAGRATDVEDDGLLKITKNTKMNVSLLLAKVFEDLLADKQRDSFREQCIAHFSELFGDRLMDSKVQAMMALSAVLQGPFEVGSALLSTAGYLEVMVAMAQHPSPQYQKVAVEVISHAASRKERCQNIMKQVVPVLKSLYENSSDDYVKLRSLVALCKLGSFGGLDYSKKAFSDGSTEALSRACLRCLNHPEKDTDLRRWATEGLAYLTLDADVKELVAGDNQAIENLIDLCHSGGKECWYAIATVLANTLNAYDEPEFDPQMVELAKFAKQHVPEPHPHDKAEFVESRANQLAERRTLIGALNKMATSDSNTTREQVARCYLAFSKVESLRGVIVQQGGGKSLIPLANDNTDKGKMAASQALAKIAISINPEVAYPGQRSLEVVRPILQLLHIEARALENYEALLALTNLASLNDQLRRRILKESGVPKIEHYMYEQDQVELRRGSLECMCNMVMNDGVLELYAGENDRVKLWVLYALEAGTEDEDFCTIRAIAGGLAMLARDPRICYKVTKVNRWVEAMIRLCAHPRIEVMHRAVVLVSAIIQSTDKEIGNQVVQSQLFEVIMALTKQQGDEFRPVRDACHECLQKLAEDKLIEPVR